MLLFKLYYNGNLTKDSNKGIADISWNSLNLPNVVTFADGSTVTYTYAADGTKLRTVHDINGTTTQKDYCGSAIYENGIAKLWQTEAGYISMDDSKYHYYLQDHQGNNRVVVSETGAAEEVNHYYAFGGLFGNGNNVQPFKYNGKELDTKKGLNWYDYGARQYDATLGRWFVADPLAEKYYAWSPYNYCVNSPVKFVDPNGKGIETVWDFFNVLLGVKSFGNNISAGNYEAAAVDGIGVVLDAVAAVLPFIPGGVSSGIKFIRKTDDAFDIVNISTKSDKTFSGLKHADAIKEGKDFERTEFAKAVSEGKDVKGQIYLVPLNGEGNKKGNRTIVDQLIRNENGTYTIFETKLRESTNLSRGQKAAEQQIKNGNGYFEIRTEVYD